MCVNACELASVIQLSRCPKRIKQCVSTLRACPYELDCSPDNHLNCHNFKYPEKFQHFFETEDRLVTSTNIYISNFLKICNKMVQDQSNLNMNFHFLIIHRSVLITVT